MSPAQFAPVDQILILKPQPKQLHPPCASKALTFGAAVPVNGPYQYKLGDGMRHITQDVEKIEGDHV